MVGIARVKSQISPQKDQFTSKDLTLSTFELSSDLGERKTALCETQSHKKSNTFDLCAIH
jgi:hypothetical protein